MVRVCPDGSRPCDWRAELKAAQNGRYVPAEINSSPMPIKNLTAGQLGLIISEASTRLAHRTLSAVIEEWGRDGWALYDRKPGLYPLQDILDLTS